jgi:serine/threonine protein kinase/tetratricopeptide (TPR) repeat protein
VKTDHRRICQACGAVVPAGGEGCPICALQGALDEGQETAELNVDLTPLLSELRFEHYQILTREDGTPLELGRGAMGVTYKAFDIDLRLPVTLKVISDKYVGDESARLRFLREARVAAKVRHTNVASVLHLGRTGNGYFYAMEFVEGDTLEKLIRCSGRLEVELGLEIATQVAAGLAAVHEQHLVHRDIKPTNIMVRLKEERGVIAKIIDLGLAKTLDESASKAEISSPGAFAGTPAFASPEQFAGLGADIRSDLYSLGVTLWVMVTGQTPFRGSSAEVMYQHQHAPLPLERLQDVPQPVAVLLEKLLEKDPAQRFQTPNEVLKVIPTVTGAIAARRGITRRNLQQIPSPGTRKPPVRSGPKKISIARLPITGSDVFGREEDIGFLDGAWSNQQVNVVTIVAWGGVGKSTLVNHWLRRMAAEKYRSAQLVFGWSFYRQGTSGGTSSADEFIDAALAWFGDPDPRIGTAWEKGERLAKLVAHRRTLLVLDGLEPLQNPPGPQEGRLREPSLQALLRELAAFNTGLCLITSRLPVGDLADHASTAALRRDLEQLSSNAGAKLLRALGVNGHEADLRSASYEFSGHCLALTLLGSYLTDAYNGDIRCRSEVSGHLAHDPRQGVHAQRVMESYQTWLGEGPELAILRMLGLFDRPADEKAVGALLKSPAIPGLTESLTDLRPTAWRTILAKLRRARLLAGEDPHNPGCLDAHPLVREYFGEQLRRQQTDAWKECNSRLYYHYRTLAPQLPSSFREMEPLFLAVICGCNAGLFREALHADYIPRIQRGDTYFAAKVLGATGPLLSTLVHFFKDGRWGSPVETAIEGQSLTPEDQLFILIQTGQYLTATRGFASAEVRVCYERAESLCLLLNRPQSLYVALMGQWRHSFSTEKLTAALQIGQRIYSLAQDCNESALMIGALSALASTLYFLGDFEAGRQYTMRGVQLWRSRGAESPVEDVDVAAVSILCYQAQFDSHLGEIASARTTMAEAISLAKALNDAHGLAVTLSFAAGLACRERNLLEAERYSSDLIELSTRNRFAYWMAIGAILRGWARSASGNSAEGIPSIEQGIRDVRATGAVLSIPFWLELKAEALYFLDRTSEALEAVKEAEGLAERFENRIYYAPLHWLRGVLLAAMGADETQIEASFREAIKIAKEQKSVSLQKRAEATYAEYRRQKSERSGGRGFRLPLW